MDSHRQASSHMIRGPRTAILKVPTPEDRTTHRRWARMVLACYCFVIVCGGIAALAHRSMTNPDDQLAQASSQKNFPYHGR